MMTASQPRRSVDADRAYKDLKDYIVAKTGLVYYANRDQELIGHLKERCNAVGESDWSAYLRLLRDEADGQREFDELVEKLTIGETFFFRHREMFDALRDTIIPNCIARNASHPRLRIWSAGCSIGAEAYSISILLQQHFGVQTRDWEISIIGTDINRSFLRRASRGVYNDWSLRSLSDTERVQYFIEDRGRWAIKPKYRNGVSFQYHNLVSHPFPSLRHNLGAFDVILCRNVIIYFGEDLIRTTIGNFHQCLVDGGWLLAGHSEYSEDAFRCFRTVERCGVTLYRKDAATCHEPGSTAEPVSTSVQPQTKPANITPPGVDAPNDLGQVTPIAAIPIPVSIPSPSDLAADALKRDLERIQQLANDGKIKMAEEICRHMLERNRLNPVCHLYHALILQHLGIHDRAESTLRKAIYLDSSCVMAHYYLGVTLQRSRQSRRAAKAMRNVLDLLSHRDPSDFVEHVDGMSVADLGKLTQMQLDSIQ
ncbi:MAG: protein-glutamate O-methyltransferase CheR [Phycisphaera sp. RhM]|nr:protein-glutamate O-methyltransferase CheR [Phycisphaera sp. RhM]